MKLYNLKIFLSQWILFFVVYNLVSDEINLTMFHWLRSIVFATLCAIVVTLSLTRQKKHMDDKATTAQIETIKIPWNEYLAFFCGCWVLFSVIFIMLSNELMLQSCSNAILIRTILGSGLISLSATYLRYITKLNNI